MAIVGGFLGGGVEMVPAGQMQVLLQWNTEDRLNIEGAVFKLTGTGGTFTANGDASGRAEIVVPAGTYTVSVTHSGIYTNDGPQKLIGEGAQSYLVLFDAYFEKVGTAVTFVCDSCPSDATYIIKNSTGATVKSGTGWSTSMVISAEDIIGDNTLELSAYGDSVSIPFSAIAGQNVIYDISEYFCEIVLKSTTPSNIITMDYEGNPIPMSVKRATVIRSNTSKTVGFEDQSKYSGVSTDSLVSISSVQITPNVATVEVTPGVASNIILIYNSGNLSVPVNGTYKCLAIGGGGGGAGAASGSGGGGGGGGHIAEGNLSLKQGTQYAITIGAGGSGGATGGAQAGNGGITSISTLLSASGGSGASTGKGGSGGSGGGSGGAGYIDTDSYTYGGGAGDYGGGGGGTYREGVNGSNGPYSGSSAAPDSIYYLDKTQGSDGRTPTGFYYGRGGGAGRGASGGNGGGVLSSDTSGSSVGCSGGGGGGGVASGDGGASGPLYNGYSPTQSKAMKYGYGGLGYGAGGGGGTAYYSRAKYYVAGGGGGGGMTKTNVASNGACVASSNGKGGAGAKGAIRMMWVS